MEKRWTSHVTDVWERTSGTLQHSSSPAECSCMSDPRWHMWSIRTARLTLGPWTMLNRFMPLSFGVVLLCRNRKLINVLTHLKIPVLIHWTHRSQWSRQCYCPHVMDEETEVHKDEMAFLMSHCLGGGARVQSTILWSCPASVRIVRGSGIWSSSLWDQMSSLCVPECGLLVWDKQFGVAEA